MDSKESKSPWLSTLLIFTVIQASAFVSVTVLQFSALNDVSKIDTDLELRLTAFDYLQTKQESHTKLKRQSGLFSELLLEQEKILAQHCVHKDNPCPPGDLGEKGIKGENGQEGDIGDLGQNGEPGEAGLPGEKGERGVMGMTGDKGQPGENGDSGEKGDIGEKGEPGLRGDKGEKGQPGPRGPKGEMGLPGLKGEPGLPGNKGIIGDRGAVGEKGQPGTKGEPGPAGLPGKDVKLISDGCECLKPPIFNDGPESQIYVSDGSTRTIPCEATGNPKPSVKVTKVTTKRSLIEYTFNNEIFSRFSSFGPSDVGRYKCVAINSFGQTERYVNVSRGVPPRITITPQNLQIAGGTSIELTCAASGIPQPEIQFFHEGILVNTTAGYFVNDGHLTIRHTVPSDSGKYYCFAKNGLGDAASNSWQLTIT